MEQANNNGNSNGFECFAILELFGHVRLAGKVTEASIGGCSFLRVDVLKPDGEVDFTRYLGNGSVYSMTPVTEEVARRVGNGSAQAPVKPWEIPKPMLPPAENLSHDLPDEDMATAGRNALIDDDDDEDHF